MTAAVHDPADVTREPMELLRNMLEEQFALHTSRLTELTVCGRLPHRGGHDPDALRVLTAAARQGVADTAHALRRVSEGTYGRCEGCHNPIPLGRLHVLPHARYCVPCQRSQPR
jgi:DnaK suppressor protein